MTRGPFLPILVLWRRNADPRIGWKCGRDIQSFTRCAGQELPSASSSVGLFPGR